MSELKIWGHCLLAGMGFALGIGGVLKGVLTDHVTPVLAGIVFLAAGVREAGLASGKET